MGTLLLAGFAASAVSGAPREAVREVFIPMKDGIRLAANLFMPEGGKPKAKFPVLLEYLPYRKDDGTAARDYAIHSYFVRRGYVTARVDIRGTGRSEGAPPDREYSDREQDGVQVIRPSPAWASFCGTAHSSASGRGRRRSRAITNRMNGPSIIIRRKS